MVERKLVISNSAMADFLGRKRCVDLKAPHQMIHAYWILNLRAHDGRTSEYAHTLFPLRARAAERFLVRFKTEIKGIGVWWDRSVHNQAS